MNLPVHFSGIILVLVTAILGLALTNGLECIECEWNADDNNATDTCLSEPFKEKNQTCEKPNVDGSGVSYICSTRATFKTVAKEQYLEKLIRDCRPKHFRCNNECKPGDTDREYTCNICCENSRCNTFPLKSKLANAVYFTNGSLNMYYYCSKTLSLFMVLCLMCFL